MRMRYLNIAKNKDDETFSEFLIVFESIKNLPKHSLTLAYYDAERLNSILELQSQQKPFK